MEKRFRGLLESQENALRWTLVRIPFDPVKVWPDIHRLRVKGTINGFAFRTSLFGTTETGYVLVVNRQMQKAAKVAAGGKAEFVLEPDLDERPTTAPPELTKLFKKDRSLKKWFEQLSPSLRKGISDRITQPKSAEARARQAEHWAEAMLLAMEGEHDLPPLLQVAFRRQPRARIGWEAMTVIQRRSHLLAIFQYKGAQARDKRAEQAVEQAICLARKKTDAPMQK